MKTIHNNKRYDSDKCEVLAELDFYDNNNYSGTRYIVRASDGQILIHQSSNYQDSSFVDDFYPIEIINFDGYTMNDEQTKRCIELGLIENIV
ncbi:MAG: hypothetical protein FJW56_03965 [Actinobacteria bacterium]|nr:hypothetical protein [Actinomycetota bacterium]